MRGATLRRFARTESGAAFPHAFQGRTGGHLPFFKVADFGLPGNERFLATSENRVASAVAKELRARPVPAQSLLMPKVGAALLGNARRITTEPAVFDNNVLAVVPEGIEIRYLHYWLSTVDAAELANPGPVPSLTEGQLLDLPVPVVAGPAQTQISDFLDAETARIDGLIANKRQLIGLLEERRAAAIGAAASGSLTCGEPMRASALPWPPRVPESWREAKLSLVAKLGSGHTPSRSHPKWWDGCTIPWITTGEVGQMRDDRIEFIEETRELISEVGLANSAAELHPAGTVVLCRTASAGYSAIMGRDMATSQDFATWTCGTLLRPRFLLLCLRAMRQDLLGRLAMGSTHKTIYMPEIQSLRIALPPVSEQDTIVEAVWSRLNPQFEAGDRLQKQIDLLTEHRQALITAAVTGELEIPEAAA